MTATIDAKTAKKLKLLPRKSRAKTFKVASGKLGQGDGKRTMTLKFSSKAKKKLKKLKSVKLTIDATVADSGGNATKGTANVTVKR